MFKSARILYVYLLRSASSYFTDPYQIICIHDCHYMSLILKKYCMNIKKMRWRYYYPLFPYNYANNCYYAYTLCYIIFLLNKLETPIKFVSWGCSNLNFSMLVSRITHATLISVTVPETSWTMDTIRLHRQVNIMSSLFRYSCIFSYYICYYFLRMISS